MAVSLDQQHAAVARMVVNQAGHVENLTGLVERNRRSADELAVQRAFLGPLRAAERTMALIVQDPALKAIIEARLK